MVYFIRWGEKIRWSTSIVNQKSGNLVVKDMLVAIISLWVISGLSVYLQVALVVDVVVA